MKSDKLTEKQERIIQAGMECFAKNGYRKTAVDDIVQKASISKGLLFHHYGNKENFYLYLYQYSYDLVYSHVLPQLNTGETDLFQKIRHIERVKLQLLCEYPYVQDFLLSARNETDQRLIEKMQEARTDRFWQEDFLHGVDLVRLRNDVDARQLINIIQWVGSGVLKESQKPLNLKKASCEMDVYLDILKKGFYKEEYL